MEWLPEERRAGEAGERLTVSGTSENAGKLAWVCSRLEIAPASFKEGRRQGIWKKKGRRAS